MPVSRPVRPSGRALPVALCLWLLSPFALAAERAFDLSRLDESADSEEVTREIAQLEAALRSQPTSAVLHARRGAAWFKLREFDKSIADFTTALRLNDKLDEAYFGRGMALGRNGQLDEAFIDLGVYIHRHPDSSLAHTKRGIRYLWKGDLDAAEKDFTRAIALDPRNAEAHDDLGVIHAQRGDYARAEQHFHQVLRADPTYQKGWHNLAMVYYITARNERALDTVERALKLVPDARDSLLLKSAVLESLGRHTEAKKLRDEAEFMPAGERSAHMPLR